MTLNPFRRRHKKNSLILLYFLGTILALANALPSYVQSNYLGTLFSITWVSLFFASANLITIFAIIYFPRLIKKLGNNTTTEIMLILFIFALLSMSLTTSIWSIFLSFILLNVASNLLWINMDILVEKFSDNSSTGRTRTIYFTMINLGWIISPTLSSFLVNKGDYYWVYIASALFLVPFLIILIKNHVRFKDGYKYKTQSIRKTVSGLWHNPNLRGIYIISFLLNLFYSTCVVYIPIYLYQTIGFSWPVLGIMFSVMLIPFVLFEFPAGYLADKYYGEKEILGIGLTITIIALFLFYSVKIPNAFLWGAILFLSRIGAALIEAMRESYFFKHVSAKDIHYINFFRTTAPLGYLVGTALGAIILNFYSLNNLFLFTALMMACGYFFLYSLKDSR